MEINEQLDKLFEDDFLIVINKPAGLIVNRSNTSMGVVTLQDVVEEEPGYDTDEVDEEFRSRSGIAHRLDKDTSGVLLIAKNFETFSNILTQFKERKVKKEYTALVRGTIEEGNLEIDAPIKRNPKDPFKFAVVNTGRDCVTYVEKLKLLEIENSAYTLVKVLPKTGRTHQIRVHMAAINHCVAGDKIYSTKAYLAEDEVRFGRLMLHAHKIVFVHPNTGKSVEFEAPLPVEFQQIS